MAGHADWIAGIGVGCPDLNMDALKHPAAIIRDVFCGTCAKSTTALHHLRKMAAMPV